MHVFNMRRGGKKSKQLSGRGLSCVNPRKPERKTERGREKDIFIDIGYRVKYTVDIG